MGNVYIIGEPSLRFINSHVMGAKIMEGDMMGELSGRWDRASALIFLQPGLKRRLNLKHAKSKAHRA